MNGKVGELAAYLNASFCPVPFSHFETSPTGEVYLCCPGWLDKPVGILENSNRESLWRSDIAQDIRESILDGSFRYCSPRFCNVIAGRRLDVKAEMSDEQLARYKAQGPTSAVFCHDLSCNLSCPSCRNEQIAVGKSEQWKYEALTKNTLIPVMESCHEVKITGSGDPFGSIHFRNLIADYCANHTGPRKIHLHTNGVLLDEKTWTSLKLEENVQDIIISIDATKEDTYKIVRRGGDFARLMKNLEFIGKLRVEGRIDNLIFVCVVQKLNYREIPDFVSMAKKFHADKAEFWQIRNWGTYSIEEFLDHAVTYSNHPGYPALMDILKDPIMNDPIVSWNDLPVPK
jgi:sulfatase maturation enzyme AslB (radical SAM superfamily)